MERRKVQVTGGSTYIVSLPKRWVTAQGITQGDAVDVHADPDGPVVVYPVGTRADTGRELRVNVDVRAPPQPTIRRIISAYLAGAETIRISADARIPTDHKQAIRSLAQTLIGIEIVEETQTEIILQDLIDPIDFDMAKALERMHQITRTMLHDACEALVETDTDLALDVTQRDPEIDRLDWMIKKQFHLIARSGRLAGEIGIGASPALHHHLVSHNLERIADHGTRLAQLILDPSSAKIGTEQRIAARTQGQTLIKLLDQAIDAFQRADADTGNDTIQSCQGAKRSARALLDQLKGNAAAQVDLALVVESLERIRNYTMDIAEVAIDHETILAQR